MFIKSLSDKIVLYFVVFGITAIAIVSTYSFYTTKNALLSRTFDQLTSVRVVKKNQIEQFFTDRLSEFSLIANMVEGQRAERINSFNHFSPQSLINHLFTNGYYKGIYIESEPGKIEFGECRGRDSIKLNTLNLQRELVVNEVFQKSRNASQTAIHDYLLDPRDSQPRMFISGSLINKGFSTKNIIVLELSLEAINAIMLEQNPKDGLGQSGESYLVGADRLMRSTSRFKKNSIMQCLVATEGVNNAFIGLTGTSVIEDYRGIKVLSSYSKIYVPGLDWVILAEIDYAEATKSIYNVRNNILLLTIFVAVVIFIISYIFSKRITQPLIKLTDAAANIRGGNLNVLLPRIKHDEIGQLTNSFNSMAESLRQKDTELLNERNKRVTAMIDGQEQERQRLSRELHDGLGQSLIALKLKLESIDGKDVCAINKTLKDVKTSFDHTITEIRRISNDLMPAVLIEFGLVTAVKNICQEISDNSDIEVKCSYNGKFTDLESRISIYLFRIMQEALNNIVKHANASIAEINLTRINDQIVVNIEDNGKGIGSVTDTKVTGNGIPNMRERVRLLKGNIDIQSQIGKGTRIIIKIPIKTFSNGPN